MPEPGTDHELDQLRAMVRRTGVGPEGAPTSLDAPPEGLWDRIATAVAEPAQPASAAPVTSIDQRRRRRWVAPALAAAAVVVLAGFAIALTSRQEAEPQVVATASLDRLGPSGSGSAELVDDGGTLQLHVDTADLDPGDGFLEVWVIDTEVQRLVSLGPVRADGTYDLPAGLDPGEFPIVDVSVEPIDGNPAHSGDSVLRGSLQF